MKINNNMFKRIFFAIVLLMMIVTSFSVFRININAESSNTVYLKDEVVEANDAGIVIAEIVGEGKAGDKAEVFFHTEGVTAIPGIDFTSVNTLVRPQYDNDGKLSYKVSIKCLVTPENREKLRTYDSENVYGRYFRIVIDKANNASVVQGRNSTNCYLPYNYKVEIVTGKTQDTATHYDESYAYFKDYEFPLVQYNKGKDNIDGKASWKTWEHSMTFNNDTTANWINAFINQKIASAYGTYTMRKCACASGWTNDDSTHMYLKYGNKELIEKMNGDYNKNDKCPGTALYVKATTRSFEQKFFWSSIDYKAEEIQPKTIKQIIIDNKNPYDDDDETLNVDDISVKTEARTIRWYQQTDEWFANKNSLITAGAVKIEPYNGVIDTGLSVYNDNKEYDIEVRYVHEYLSLVDSTIPQITGEFIDDSELQTTNKLKFYVRFNEPVMMARPQEALPITFNNSTTPYYANYVTGNYSDTLVFEIEEPPHENIRDVKYEFPNNNVGDLAFNIDEFSVVKNNRLPVELTEKERTLTFLNGAVNLLKPTLEVDQNSAPSTAPHNIYNILLSINNNGQKDIKDGKVYYSLDKTEEWVKEGTTTPYTDEELANPDLYENVHEFTPEENGSITITIVKDESKKIDSGVYWLHAFAISGYGLTDVNTFGGYNLDGDPPVANQLHPDPNNLTEKTFKLDMINKATNVSNIFLKLKYTGAEGVQEKSILFFKNGAEEESLKSRINIATGNENTVYSFRLNLADPEIQEIMNANKLNRLEVEATFYIEDAAGNKNTTNIIKTVYDSRDLFSTSLSVPLVDSTHQKGYTLIDDINVSANVYDLSTIGDSDAEKDIYIEIPTTEEAVRGEIDSGVRYYVLINGTTEVDADSTKYRVTLSDLKPGYYDIVPMVKGKVEDTNTNTTVDVDRISNNIQFYITNNKQDETENKKTISSDLVLTNKVYQLQEQRYYYLDEGGSTVISHPYGATYNATLNKSEGGSVYPSFSNINEAKLYVKFMELQDLYLVKLTPSIASLLNSGQATTAFVKAAGETVSAQENQLWIRYKKSTWENTASAYGWAYYYYGNGNLEDGININALPNNLQSAINEVVNRITSKGKTVFLVEEDTLNQRTGAPYLASTQIHASLETATGNKIGKNKFITEAKYEGDKGIYKNTVKIKVDNKEIEYALATNMQLRVTDSTRLFYQYAVDSDPNNLEWKELIATDGQKLSEVLPNQTSGPYLIREYGDSGVSEYYIYYDRSVPNINVVVGNDVMVLNGEVLNYSSDSFIIKGFTSSSDYPTEIDDLAYIALFSYPNKTLLEVLYASDFINTDGSVKDKKLEEKNYYVQVGDRSGNIATYTVLLSNSELKVDIIENDSKTSVTVKVYERSDSEIYSYEVYCNEVLVTTEFAESKTFKEPGIYRIKVVDIYGNEVSKTAEFAYKIPQITWYYLTSEDTYSKYNPDNIVSMAIYDDSENSRITNVYTSTMLKLQFVSEYGGDNIQYEVLDLNAADYGYTDVTSTLTINKLASFRLRVWFESLPQNDHTFIIRVDNEAPTITATFVGKQFVQYTEYDGDNKVIKTSAFDKVDLEKYEVGQSISVDTLKYTISSDESEKNFEDGAVINGGHIVLSFFDPSKIKKFSISRNGKPIEMELDNEGKLIINSYGFYEITVSDMLGNVKKFTFTNTSDPITVATIDGEELPDSTKKYGHNNITVKYLYVGENRLLIETPNGKETLIFRYDGESILYGTYVCAIEKTQDENGQIVDTKIAEFVENPDFKINLTEDNIKEKVWIKAVETDYYTISIMIENKKPVLKLEVKPIVDNNSFTIKVEMLYNAGNTVLPSYYLAELSNSTPKIQIYSGNLEVEPKEGSKYIYISEILSINPQIDPTILSISFGYSEKPNIEKLEVIYENGSFIKPLIGEADGFYKIVVLDIYNNQTEYVICKVDSLTTIVEVTYMDGSKNEFVDNENVIYSNSRINFNVYSEGRDTVSFEIDGEEYAGIYDSGITTLEVYKQGEHVVEIIGANDVREKYNININTDSEFVFNEEWMNGYTENALLKNQGYTSTPLTIVKAERVEYIAYKYADSEIKVLYDNMSETKFIEDDNLTLSIGNDGNGDYIVYFKNIFGDVVSKTIHYSNTAALVLSRKTVAENNAFAIYDLNKAIEENFYSNYVLKFETTSIKYEFRIDDQLVSLDEPKTIEFSNSNGNGSFGYDISYLDEYGNYLEFRAELYRTDIKIDTSLMKEILVGNDTYTKDNIIVMFADDLTGYVSYENGDMAPYESGTVFYKDGRYEFRIEDIAGNRNTYVINHKSINHYTLTNSITQSQIIIGSVINNASVVYQATDDSNIIKVFKNSQLVDEYNSKTFSTTGHWEILIEDSVGNQSYAGFYIINNPLISFEYQAPFDYEITEIWHTKLNGQRETIEAVLDKPMLLTENGDYAIVVSSKNSTTTFNFSITINDTPPTAELVGAENGGVTSRNVSLKGLRSGDVVEIYKEGKLISITDVSSSNSAPEITTGGNYKVVIKAISGAEVEYTFTRKRIANTATSAFIIIACLVVVAGIGIGLLYHTKIKNDSEK